MQPIAETYLVLMHALMVDGDKNLAFKVFQSMLSAGIDARRGWLLLCKEYFRFGWVVYLYCTGLVCHFMTVTFLCCIFPSLNPVLYQSLLLLQLKVPPDCCLHRFPDDAYALVQKWRLDGWYPDADLYEVMLAWMCTQEDLVDAAEQIVRQEMQVITQYQRGMISFSYILQFDIGMTLVF